MLWQVLVGECSPKETKAADIFSKDEQKVWINRIDWIVQLELSTFNIHWKHSRPTKYLKFVWINKVWIIRFWIFQICCISSLSIGNFFARLNYITGPSSNMISLVVQVLSWIYVNFLVNEALGLTRLTFQAFSSIRPSFRPKRLFAFGVPLICQPASNHWQVV